MCAYSRNSSQNLKCPSDGADGSHISRQVYISRRYPMRARTLRVCMANLVRVRENSYKSNWPTTDANESSRKTGKRKKLILFELSNTNTTCNNRVFPKKKNDRTQITDRNDNNFIFIYTGKHVLNKPSTL